MSRPNKQKISTDSLPGGGFFAAFSGLEMQGLPENPAQNAEKDAASGAQNAPEAGIPTKKGRVILRKETAHRGGKTVIVVDGFDPSMSDEAIETLGKRLRAACGCGGAAKNRTLEMQGDQPAKIRAWLENEGFRVGGVA